MSCIHLHIVVYSGSPSWHNAWSIGKHFSIGLATLSNISSLLAPLVFCYSMLIGKLSLVQRFLKWSLRTYTLKGADNFRLQFCTLKTGFVRGLCQAFNGFIQRTSKEARQIYIYRYIQIYIFYTDIFFLAANLPTCHYNHFLKKIKNKKQGQKETQDHHWSRSPRVPSISETIFRKRFQQRAFPLHAIRTDLPMGMFQHNKPSKTRTAEKQHFTYFFLCNLV